MPGGDGCKDLAWFHPAGRELADADWFDAGLRTIGMYLDGRGLRHRDRRGEVIVDDSYLLLLHAGDDAGDVHAARRRPGPTATRSCSTRACAGGAAGPGSADRRRHRAAVRSRARSCCCGSRAATQPA